MAECVSFSILEKLLVSLAKYINRKLEQLRYLLSLHIGFCVCVHSKMFAELKSTSSAAVCIKYGT